MNTGVFTSQLDSVFHETLRLSWLERVNENKVDIGGVR